MDTQRIRKIRGKAIQIARKKGFQEEEAEDFSQYALFHLVMKGRKTHLDNLLVDYLRERYIRTKPHYKTKKPKIIPEVRLMHQLTSKNGRSWDSNFDALDFDRMVKLVNNWEADRFGKLRCMLILRHIWGFSMSEIGYCFNVTESRISQYFDFIYKYLKRKL